MNKYILYIYSLFLGFILPLDLKAQEANYTWFDKRFENDSIATKKLIGYTCHCFQGISTVNYDTNDFTQNNEIMKNALECFFKELKKRKVEFGLSEVSDELIAYQKDTRHEQMGAKLRALNAFFKAYASRDCPYIFAYYLIAEVNFDKFWKKERKRLDSTIAVSQVESNKMMEQLKKESEENRKVFIGILKSIEGNFPAYIVIKKQDKTEERIWIMHLPEEYSDIVQNVSKYKNQEFVVEAYRQQIYFANTQKHEYIWALKAIKRNEKQ
jgi:hypothetical protein